MHQNNITMNRKTLYLFILSLLSGSYLHAQHTIKGKVMDGRNPIADAIVQIEGSNDDVITDFNGFFTIKTTHSGSPFITIIADQYREFYKKININEGTADTLFFDLSPFKNPDNLDEVIVTGTMKEVKRSESPVNVEVYNHHFFRRNPTPNIFEALQNINGIRPQLNCQVCNTGDIHINGLEGPYTMVLIDGMPIVSALSTVYGLSGIPSSLIDRVEIVKGPASSLYGSEAVGGLINIITKNPNTAPLFFADVMSTSWAEINADIGFKTNISDKVSMLTGINYYNYLIPFDHNNDNFTDIPLQHRISLFSKLAFQRKENRVFNIATRLFYEDRWGGEMQWNKSFRGGDSVYGESIYTKRWELLANYQLPFKEKIMLSFSYNMHDQNSVYGTTQYNAQQQIAFSQLTWDKKYGIHDALLGVAVRNTYYDDNTTATAIDKDGAIINNPDKIWLPGIFLQDELALHQNHKLLLGFRYDYNNRHGNIFTPRLAYKWNINDRNIFRLNAGTGYRIVNLFTEDHAALTGARSIHIKNELNPERSYNINLNYIKKIYQENGTFIDIDASAFYTHFNNKILPDYDSDPNKIIYDNLDGYAVSNGVSLNLDMNFNVGLKVIVGGTYMNNVVVENGISEQQILTEKFTGTWSASYNYKPWHLSFDYTGNVYSPMRLPLLSDYDPRDAYAPWWSIQNIQFTQKRNNGLEIYAGIKNILNWTPNQGNPFIISRSHDPFDKKVNFDSDGKAMRTAENPYGLVFDPNYVYAPNQGARGFLGIRYTLR